jgi:protein-disulfide isomerase
MKQFILSLLISVVATAAHATDTAKVEAAKAAISAPAANPFAASALLKQQPFDRVLGNEKAPVTIVEYSSLSCPHCADFHTKTLPEIEKKYVESGQVRFLVRPFALNEPALMGSMLTYCVPKDKYYSFIKVLFSMQSKWAMTLDYKDNLKRIARVGGVSDAEYDACMANQKQQEVILAIRKTGDVALETFTKTIEKHLADKSS